jgi:hypothetical protein
MVAIRRNPHPMGFSPMFEAGRDAEMRSALWNRFQLGWHCSALYLGEVKQQVVKGVE